jgi:hypothetical protein
MLTLGYQGKYQLDGGEANEERQSLLKQLNALLPAAKGKINTPIFIRNRRPDIRLAGVRRGNAFYRIAADCCRVLCDEHPSASIYWSVVHAELITTDQGEAGHERKYVYPSGEQNSGLQPLPAKSAGAAKTTAGHSTVSAAFQR